MKGLKTVTAVLLGVALLAAAPPASSAPAASAPEASTPAAYLHYVACGLSRNAKPSHKCSKKSKKGAFFESLKGEISYKVCVRFPTGKNICAAPQKAMQETLYVNKIRSNIPGKHRVTWFVGGKRVGLFYFDVTG